jgi:protein-tyrosine phosphatase
MEDFEVDHTGRIYLPYEEHFIRVAEELGVQLECARTPIKDLSVPSRAEMRHILDIVDKAISQHMPVYVHCLGGLGRTGTVVGCFLARHGIANGDEVLAKIMALRQFEALGHQPSPQTPLQQRFVCSWETGE